MLKEIAQTGLTSICALVYLFIIAKLIGHRQIAQLDVFDYITGITVGSIAAELATELESPWKPAAAMLVFTIVTFLQAIVLQRCSRLRKIVNGSPTILLDNGKLYRQNMKDAHLELSEFLMLCREAGYFDLGAVQTAVYEYNGKITFLPAADRRPATPSDLSLSPPKEQFFVEVIMDGAVMSENLNRMGKDRRWLDTELAAQGYASPKDVLLGLCDSGGHLSLYRME